MIQYSGQYYYQHKRAKVRDLVNRLQFQEKNSTLSSAEKINAILSQRRQKLRDIRNLKDTRLEQGPVKPKRVQETFSNNSPISSNEKYLHEKYRTKILEPDRAKSKKLNVKAGSLDMSRISSMLEDSHPEAVNKKFSEYIRLVDSQTGSVKKKKLEQQLQRRKNFSSPNPLKIKMKSTFFKKPQSNNYDFYKPPMNNISRQSSFLERESNRFSEDTQYNTIDVYENIPQKSRESISILRRSGVHKKTKITKISRTMAYKNNKDIQEKCRETHKVMDGS